MNKLFTVPLPMLNGLTTPFAMRREGDGSATDLSWRDSYVRVTLTKLVTFSSDGVTHLTSGSIVILAVTDFVVGGPIAAFSYLSLLDATLNHVKCITNSNRRLGRAIRAIQSQVLVCPESMPAARHPRHLPRSPTVAAMSRTSASSRVETMA